jgi:hypothetical protein
MRRLSILVPMLCMSFASLDCAAEEPVFQVELKDGVITPLRLEVPARTRFKVVVTNRGQGPAEFESVELHKEVVVPAGSSSVLIIRTLDPGDYKFFDDFQPNAPAATLIAK